MLQPTVPRTWAPKEETPIQRQWERHDRLSVIGTITVAPRRNRMGVYWTIRRSNIGAEDVVPFLRSIRWQLRRKLLVILDRWKVHRARAMREYLQRHRGKVRAEPLPAYAPDLNPGEQVWNHTKCGDLPNLAPPKTSRSSVPS